LLTRALIEGDTAIPSIILTHSRLQEILKPLASIRICEEESIMGFDDIEIREESKKESKV
jgi:hypothetical protein